MKNMNVVIAQSDSRSAQDIAASMHAHFRSIAVARSVEELRNSIPKTRADVVVLDLELADYAELRKLHQAFNHTRFICTHRIPDEQMWTSAVDAGADDVCFRDDVNSIVHAAAGCSFGAGAAA